MKPKQQPIANSDPSTPRSLIKIGKRQQALRSEEENCEDQLSDLRTELTDEKSAYDAEANKAVDMAQWAHQLVAEVDEAKRLEGIAVQSINALRARSETLADHFDDGIERRIDPDRDNRAVSYAEYRRFRCVDASANGEDLPTEDEITSDWEELTQVRVPALRHQLIE